MHVHQLIFGFSRQYCLTLYISARRNMRTELRSSSAGGWIRSTSSPPTNQTARSRLSVASWERREAFASAYKNESCQLVTHTDLPFPLVVVLFSPTNPGVGRTFDVYVLRPTGGGGNDLLLQIVGCAFAGLPSLSGVLATAV